MKLITGLLKVAIPILVLWILLKTNVWLGVAAFILFIVWWGSRSLTSIYAYLGNVNYQQGKMQEALTWLNKAAVRKDCKPQYLIGYSFLLLKLGKLELAEEMLQRARGFKLSREEEMGLESNASLLLWKQGRLEEATAKMEKLYEEFKNTNLYGTLGYYYILSGDLDKALAFNREAYEFNESGGVIIDNLGQTHYLRGEYEEALALYKKLEELKPTFPEAYYNYGLVLEAMGQRNEALDYMRKSLEYPISLLSTVTREEIESTISSLEAAG
ncbi:tetratricopeptide repeat protein [Gorillibacterium sp. sgz5001074]|uniref:tetratricopeptide repeat protein n=1 Tax=Gorillibacterium sp. sgz5001074 TaxID=3446695 RepID=UPI003F67D0A5